MHLTAIWGWTRSWFTSSTRRRGTLTPNDPPFFAGKAGAGPRHLAFHPNGRLAFLVNELDSTLVSLNYDAGKGALSAADAVSLLPADFAGRSSAAEVAVHPSGKWVYGSNRGHDSIAVFACEASTGKLTFGRAPFFRRQNAAKLRDRSDGGVSPGRQPGLGRGGGVSDRPGERGAWRRRGTARMCRSRCASNVLLTN